MSTAKIITGRLTSPRNVELDEAVTNVSASARVEVIVRESVEYAGQGNSVADLVNELPAGNRTRREIDEQVAKERSAWDEQ